MKETEIIPNIEIYQNYIAWADTSTDRINRQFDIESPLFTKQGLKADWPVSSINIELLPTGYTT